MNTFRKLLSGFIALSMLAACSDDISKNGNDENQSEYDAEGSYLSLDILMPNGRNPFSRSETTNSGGSTGGTEIGSSDENTVSSALIVLARRTNFGFIAAGEVKGSNLSTLNAVEGTSYRALTRIYKSNLAAYYEDREDLSTNPTVYVFVFCNPNKDLIDMFRYGETADYNNTEWLNATARVTQGLDDQTDYNMGIWTPNSFLMNNVDLPIRELPKNLLEWEAYSTSDNPFHLSDVNENTEYSNDLPDNGADNNRGAIKVERSVARFDFKDGSPLGDAKYHVLYHAHNGIAQDGTNGTDEEPLIDVQLYTMCLVNMSNQFYYLPRVSNNGRNTTTTSSGSSNGWTLCGNEKPAERDENGLYSGGNYAVGPYATQYVATVVNNFSNYFNYPFFEDDGEFNVESPAADRWGVYNVSDVANGSVGDNYVNNENGVTTKGTYKVWRYVTENVIPGGPDNQQNGISTGVVFKARLLGGSFSYLDELDKQYAEFWEKGTFKAIAQLLNGETYELSDGSTGKITGDTYKDPILYYTDGKVYMNWRHVRQGAIQAAVNPIFTNGEVTGIEINRSNSLYRAVFGDGGIPDGMVYCYLNDKGEESYYQIKNDDRGYSHTCADYLWTVWDDNGAGRKNDEKLTAFRKAVTENDITIYQSSIHTNPVTGEKIPGYYCYYYYWNRHNDNNLAGIMGPMEFAVVRNNVYKLSVDKISRLGHPRIPDNDPDDPTPETPDEVAEVYIDVNVQVMPWAVRLNSIVF